MHTLFVGAHTVLLSPLSFLKRPVLWVELMSRYRATQTGAPNFALKLTARKWAEEAENRCLRGDAPVDLSPLRRILNAAEPITVDAMQEFVRAFAPCGLDPKVRNAERMPTRLFFDLLERPFIRRLSTWDTASLKPPCTSVTGAQLC